MSGAKLDIRIDVIKDPDIVEASESMIENLDPVLLDGNDSTKKVYIGHNLSKLGRLTKWAIELSEHDITYKQRIVKKSQVLADFVADFSVEIMPEVEQEALCTSSERSDLWVLCTDGASNASGSGLGLVLEVPTGEVIHQSVRCPKMTNNEAEYEAVIAGLKLALKYGARRVILRCDSQLFVNQVTGTFQIKDQRLQKYQTKIHKLLPEFDECRFNQIPRAQNIEADGIAKLAATTKNITKENV
uniref:RNase H type-1 domain-containing protein n=1 Tax=Nicotiana tabacum TaxID=4097 RepID=A0A1S4CBB8_TOBAC